MQIVKWAKTQLDSSSPPPGPFRARWSSPIHSTRVAARLGLLLGVSFTICFATGLLSHAFQNGVSLPSRPVNFYQITQGLHVATGLISIPLLFGKLLSVYPRFWAWPPVHGFLSVLERGALGVLVVSALFQVTSGAFNIASWYAFPFFFTSAHYAMSFVLMGSLGIHIVAKIARIKEGLTKNGPDALQEELKK